MFDVCCKCSDYSRHPSPVTMLQQCCPETNENIIQQRVGRHSCMNSATSLQDSDCNLFGHTWPKGISERYGFGGAFLQDIFFQTICAQDFHGCLQVGVWALSVWKCCVRRWSSHLCGDASWGNSSVQREVRTELLLKVNLLIDVGDTCWMLRYLLHQ